MSLRIAIAGVVGRMGQELVRAADDCDAVVVGGTVRPGSANDGEDIGHALGGAALGRIATGDPAKAAAGAEIWIDFTTPAACLAALDALVDVPSVSAVVIGTTGFDSVQRQEIGRHAERIPIVLAGNFSFGAAVLAQLVKWAARHLGAGWDIDILDTHHAMKRDAPSGTALTLAAAAREGRGDEGTQAIRFHTETDAPRQPGEIGIAARRAGDIVGEHEVLFAGAGETVSLQHTARDRSIFARGALRAARWVRGRPPGLTGAADMLHDA